MIVWRGTGEPIKASSTVGKCQYCGAGEYEVQTFSFTRDTMQGGTDIAFCRKCTAQVSRFLVGAWKSTESEADPHATISLADALRLTDIKLCISVALHLAELLSSSDLTSTTEMNALRPLFVELATELQTRGM